MARLITEERRVLTGSLHTVLDIHQLFNLHKCDWMARDPGTYSEETVREFYASYAATLRGSISKRSKPLAQDPLTSTLRNSEQREAMILWLARYIAADGERAEWVTAPRDSGVPIWHCDRLVHPTGALDIGLIRDEANIAAPRREPQVEIPLLDTDLADTVGQAQGNDLSAPDHTNTVPGSSSQAASMGSSYSRSTPQLGAVVVPLARVQKLEAQMATLLHHIQPWMQKLIAESEARVERRMEDMMDRKVQAVNNRLDGLNRVLGDRPGHRSLRCGDIASLRSDVEVILAAPSVEPQVTPLHWLMIQC
ncbi:hypothetical protein H5410_050592 [Solanum commersonii]|uniref:Integrase core domain containing protein n=1 Tax=Solanum commersonii TaxID=4109 RepID=A0A9J5WXH4_SOLCO|nr:hypothetical protein H5410_050592 [Solanum commersonii]